MTRRRAQTAFHERVVTSIETMIPGTVGGRVVNAGPASAPSGERAASRGDIGTVDSASGVLFKRDRFELVADGAQDHTLTFLPLDDSEHVYLNGVEQDEGADWTRDEQVLSILAAMDALTDDMLEVRYSYDAGAPVQPTDSDAVPRAGTALLGSNDQLLTDGAVAGDTAVIFVAIPDTRAVDSLNGYTDQGSCTVTHDGVGSVSYTYTLHVLTKVITSSTDVPTYTGVGASGGGHDIVWGVYVFPGEVNILDCATDTVADDTSGSTPAVTVGSNTARAWVTISDSGTLNEPARGQSFGASAGTDIDLTLAVDPDLSASPTTETAPAGWMLATVALQ